MIPLCYKKFVWIFAQPTWATPASTHSISELKSWVLKLTFLALKMMLKSGLKFILKFIEPLQRYIPANLPGQFSPSGQIFLHWAAADLKGLHQFQKNISSSFFQYSDRTVACTEINDISAESLGSQLFGARRAELAWQVSRYLWRG